MTRSEDDDHHRKDRGARKSDSGRHNPNKKKKRKLASNARSNHHGHHRHHHYHAAPQAEAPDPAEAAAAALLEHFRQILQGEGQHQPEIDVQKARNALEATQGNVELAVQLYWDEYVFSSSRDFLSWFIYWLIRVVLNYVFFYSLYV